jgi:hypothetical protein
MTSDFDRGSPGDRGHGGPPTGDPSYPGERGWQNGGYKTPDSIHHGRPAPSPGPGTPGQPDREWDEDMRRSGERTRTTPRTGRSASGQTRVCKKCGLQLTGQFVRALDGTFHLDCFKCRVC